MKITQEVQGALTGSIKKWEDIIHLKIPDRGSDNCPLCTLFEDTQCLGCPVSRFTGGGNCYGTPYYTFSRASLRERPEHYYEDSTRWVWGYKSYIRAKEMLSFLKYLDRICIIWENQ